MLSRLLMLVFLAAAGLYAMNRMGGDPMASIQAMMAKREARVSQRVGEEFITRVANADKVHTERQRDPSAYRLAATKR